MRSAVGYSTIQILPLPYYSLISAAAGPADPSPLARVLQGAPGLDSSVALAELKRFMAHNGIVLDAISSPVLFFVGNWDSLDASKDMDAAVPSESLNP